MIEVTCPIDLLGEIITEAQNCFTTKRSRALLIGWLP
jgi:hypothetical protein